MVWHPHVWDKKNFHSSSKMTSFTGQHVPQVDITSISTHWQNDFTSCAISTGFAICYFHYFHHTPQKRPALLLKTSSSCWHHHCLKLGAVNCCLRTLTKMKIAVFIINMSAIIAWQVGGSAPSLCAICLACAHDFVSIHPKILFCGTEATVLKLLPDSLWLHHKKQQQQQQHNLLRRAQPEYGTDQKQ